MKLNSNIKSVISRLEALQAGYPEAVRRAIAPEWWTPQLVRVARTTLEAQIGMLPADTPEAVQTRARFLKMIPQITDTVIGVARPEGSLFKLWLPPDAVADVDLNAAARFAGDQWTPSGRAKKWAMPNPQSEENLQAARQAVLDWVTLEKQRDERDRRADGSWLSNEEIASRVEVILGLKPSMTGRNDEMDAAADRLRGAIQAWLDGEETTPSGNHRIESPAVNRSRGVGGLSRAQANQWLGAVLAAWVAYVRVRLRERIESEFQKLHKKVQAAQRELI